MSLAEHNKEVVRNTFDADDGFKAIHIIGIEVAEYLAKHGLKIVDAIPEDYDEDFKYDDR